MAKEKQVTNNELAQMVARGFEGVDKRFEAVDKRFETINKRFIDLEERMNKRFDRIENILLRAHENRLDHLEDFMRQAKTVLKIK